MTYESLNEDSVAEEEERSLDVGLLVWRVRRLGELETGEAAGEM